MQVVAIHRLQGNEDLLARELAGLLGKSVLEARGRVRAAASGPAVVATFADLAAAERLAGELRAHAFEVLHLNEAEIKALGAPAAVEHVALGPDTLQLRIAGGTRDIPDAAIAMVLSGMASRVQRKTVVEKKRTFSPTRALITGGLMLHKKTETKRTVEREERERFVIVGAADGALFSCKETTIGFGDLGAPRLASSAGNLGLLASALIRRCPQAIHDDRLENRMVLHQILGGTLGPERHLDVALALLVRSLEPRVP